MDINDYAEQVGFGDGTNVTKFDESGQVKREGSATQWDDIVGPVTGLKLSAVTGTVSFDWDENAIVFDSDGVITDADDRVIWNIQKPHKAKADSELHFHIHYEQTDEVVRTMTLQYRIQGNSDIKTTSWTTISATTQASNHQFTYVSGTLNQILKFPSIDWSAVAISSTVQFRMTRTDSETGDIVVTFVDGHVEIDSDGSDTEWVK